MKYNKKILPLLLLSATTFTTVYASDDDGETSEQAGRSVTPLLSDGVISMPPLNLSGTKSLHASTPPVKRGPSEQPETNCDIELWGKTCSFKKEQFARALLLFKGRQAPLTIDLWLGEISAFIVSPDAQQKNRASQNFLTDLTAGYQPVLAGQYFQNLYAFLILLFQHAADAQLVPEQEAIAEALRVFGDENVQLKQQLEASSSAEATSATTIADLREKLAALEKTNGELERTNAEETKLKTQAIREKTQAADRIAAAEAAKTEALAAKQSDERRLAESERKLQDAEAATQQANNAREVEKKRADEAEHNVAQRAVTQADLQAKLDEAIQRAGVAEEVIQQANAEKDDARRRADQSQGELEHLRRTSEEAIQQEKTEKEAAIQRASAAETAIQQASEAREAAIQRSEELQRALEDLRGTSEEEIQQANEARDEANQRAGVAEEATQQEKAEKEAAIQRAGVLEAQNDALQIQVNSIAGLNAEIARLQRDLGIAQPLAASVPGLHQEMLRLQAALDAAVSQTGRILYGKGELKKRSQY